MSTQSGPEYDVFVLYAKEDTAWVKGVLFDQLRGAATRTSTSSDSRSSIPKSDNFTYFVKRNNAHVRSMPFQCESFLAFTHNLTSRSRKIKPLVHLLSRLSIDVDSNTSWTFTLGGNDYTNSNTTGPCM